MSAPLKNVAVAGASGNIGVPIVRELLAQGFTVTVLARASSSASYPAGVSAVRRVDFSSVPDLTAALRGQDAVVSALADHGVRGGAQRTLADATAAAGVRRFVPSEFGMHVPQVAAAAADGSATPTERAMADFARPKIELQAHLDELAARDENFSWTGLNVGSFFDWSLDLGLYGLDKATRTATIYDSGDESFQASTVSFIARAVAAVLSRPDATRNRYLRIASSDSLNGSGRVSQNEILKVVEAETGAPWTVNRVDTAPLQRTGLELFARGERDEAFIPLLKRLFFAEGHRHFVPLAESDNALLGLEEEDLVPVIKEWVRKN